MKISDLLSPTDVMIDVRTSGKRPLLQELAAKAAAGLGLPADQVASYLLKREQLGSTGIGKGIAIPHAKLARAKTMFGIFARVPRPIDFESLDGARCELRMHWQAAAIRRSVAMLRIPTKGES